MKRTQLAVSGSAFATLIGSIVDDGEVITANTKFAACFTPLYSWTKEEGEEHATRGERVTGCWMARRPSRSYVDFLTLLDEAIAEMSGSEGQALSDADKKFLSHLWKETKTSTVCGELKAGSLCFYANAEKGSFTTGQWHKHGGTKVKAS